MSGGYTDIAICKLSDGWAVLVQEDWRDSDPFSMRLGWRVDSVWRAKSEARRRVAFLENDGA